MRRADIAFSHFLLLYLLYQRRFIAAMPADCYAR